MWHVYTSIYECLAHVSTFTLLSNPSVIIACKSRLCVAINNTDQALFLISMFNTRTLKKYTHHCDSDHKYLICDFAKHPLSGIFISVGMDKTIKFWDKHNLLLTTLLVSCVPTCVCLANDNADIVYSMNNKLVYASTSSFIPDCFVKKIVGKISDVSKITPPNLLFGPLENIQSICIDFLSIQRYEFQLLFCSTPFIYYTRLTSEQSVPLAHPVLPNMCTVDGLQFEGTNFAPIPVLKSGGLYQQQSWNDYFLSNSTSRYEMILYHDIFDVSNVFIPGKCCFLIHSIFLP